MRSIAGRRDQRAQIGVVELAERVVAAGRCADEEEERLHAVAGLRIVRGEIGRERRQADRRTAMRRGDDAIDSPDVAQKLAKEIERVRGIGALFATGGDLQIALRRTQDPPTQPVEIPIG